jgi:ELWxxDGT repeat protein
MFGKVIFSMNNSSSGRELYKTDGTVPGTSLLKEINIGAGSGLIASDFSINANNTMFFVATINGTKFELWKSDGTPAGTTAITSLNATSEYLGQWSQINGKHTFSMYDGAVNVGRELYCINTITAVEPTKEPALTANVRPNPTANLLTVSISENTTIEEVKIMNLEGQIMMDVSDALKGNKEGSIDLSSLSPGIYLLKMVSKDGGRIVKKIEKI